jgi:hypothetical protein
MNQNQKSRIADLIEEVIEASKSDKESIDRIHYLGHIDRSEKQYRIYLTFTKAKTPISDRNID